jgi:hypothetical protein
MFLHTFWTSFTNQRSVAYFIQVFSANQSQVINMKMYYIMSCRLSFSVDMFQSSWRYTYVYSTLNVQVCINTSATIPWCKLANEYICTSGWNMKENSFLFQILRFLERFILRMFGINRKIFTFFDFRYTAITSEKLFPWPVSIRG